MENLSLLIEAAQKKSENMIILMDHFTPLIRRLAHRLPYEYQDAEQDMRLSFLEIVNRMKLEQMRCLEDKYLLGYIKNAMTNRYINLLYASTKQKEPKSLIDYRDVEVEEGVGFNDQIELLSLLRTLPKIQKDVLYFRYFYGYSDIEIAQKLHITRQAVNKIKNRALKELKRFYI